MIFRCTTCNFVLKQEDDEPNPSYCPNCAIQHLGGEMVPVADYGLGAADQEQKEAAKAAHKKNGHQPKRESHSAGTHNDDALAVKRTRR